MALTQYYVNPAIAGNSGTGTSGDPFGDLQYALNTVTRDATNGDQINIKAGTAEILAAALTLATYGTPAEGAPLILRGYTATANDGGMGEINCNGATMWASGYGHVHLTELVMHNFGNNTGIGLNAGNNIMYRCEVHKGASTPSSKILVNLMYQVVECYIHDAGTGGTGLVGYFSAINNYIYNCPNGITSAQIIMNNIVVDCAIGIAPSGDNRTVIGNTVYSSTANTGTGINIASGFSNAIVINNIIEGYSGSGGKGIAAAADIGIKGYNAFYNNATNESLGDVYVDLGNDAALAASPFTNAATGDFSLKTTVVGAIDGAFPGAWYGPASTTDHADIGAVQNGAGTGGGGAVSISPFKGNIG